MKRRINPLLHLLGRIYSRLFGWTYVNELPNLPKFIMISGPHTSYWDAVHAVGIIWTLKLKPTIFIKHTMFRFPFGWFFRWIGGVPINRTSPRGTVAQVADEFERRESWILLIAPEGRRNKGEYIPWKTGFYRIAAEANVPIVPVRADFKHKQIVIGEPLMPTGAIEEEMAELRAFIDAGYGVHH